MGFLLRQLGGLVMTVWLSTVVIFTALALVPGDPLVLLSGGRQLSPAAKAALVEQYGLDEPLPLRYVKWLGNVLHGDFGTSLVFRSPVSSVVDTRLSITAFLVLYAAVLIVLVGITSGVLAGAGPRWLDSAITGLATVGMATPAFVAAVALILVFSVGLGWFPVFGAGEGVLDRLWHLTLPAIALAIGACALISRVTRSGVRKELTSEHVEWARSRGFSAPRIVTRHALRNSLIPIVTATGIALVGLLSLAAVVETSFGINGIGALLVTSVLQKDFAVVQAICLLIVVLFATINVLVDMLYVLIDPRIRKAAR